MREYVGRYVTLPPVESHRSCGCSAVLIEWVAEFLEEHYYMALSTQWIACALGFESRYFGKMFKKHTGLSLTKQLKQIRLLHAKKLLEDPFLSMVEIAKRTGFSDASYFAREFRGALGITPSRFRDITREQVGHPLERVGAFSDC